MTRDPFSDRSDAYARYRPGYPAEPPFGQASIDLVTVAQALHWLDSDVFFGAARRVLRTGGVMAAWCYSRRHASPDLEEVLDDFYSRMAGENLLPAVAAELAERWGPPERGRALSFPLHLRIGHRG